MIKSKDDYRFVSESDMRHIVIEGKPFGARNEKLILTGEDIAFLREAIIEREEEIPGGVIQVQDKNTSVTECDKVFGMARTGEWIRPDKAPKNGDIVEICSFSGEHVYEDRKVARKLVNDFNEWNDKEIEDHIEEAQKKKEEWEKRVKDEKEGAAEKEDEIRSQVEGKIEEIDEEVVKAKDEVRKTAEGEYAEIARKYAEGEITRGRMKVLVQQAVDKESDGIEQAEVEGELRKEGVKTETEQSCREAWDPYYKALYEVALEEKEYDEKWEKDHGKEYDKRYLELCESLKDACANSYTEVGFIESYSKGIYEDDKARAKGKVRRSTFDAIIDKRWANDVASATKVEYAFADLERMVTRVGEDVDWMRAAHTDTYTYDGKLQSKYRRYEGKNGEIEHVLSDGHSGSSSYSSKVFRIYFGSRSDVDDKTEIEVLADVIFKRDGNGYTRGSYDDPDDPSRSYSEFKYNRKVMKFTYAGLNATEYISRIDDAADARDDKIKEANEKYEDGEKGLMEARIEAEFAAKDNYEKTVGDLDEELKEVMKKENEKFFRKVNEENAEVNGKIKKDPKNATRYYNEWVAKYNAASSARVTEIAAAKQRRNEGETEANEKMNEEIKKASTEYKEAVRKIAKVRNVVIAEANQEFSEKRIEVYEELDDKKDEANESADKSIRAENESWSSKQAEIETEIDDAFNSVFEGEEGVWWEGTWFAGQYFVNLRWDEECEPEDEKKDKFKNKADKLAGKMTQGRNDHLDAIEGIEDSRFSTISAMPVSIRENQRMIFECTVEPVDSDSCHGDTKISSVNASIGEIRVTKKYRTLTDNDYSELYKATDDDDEENE